MKKFRGECEMSLKEQRNMHLMSVAFLIGAFIGGCLISITPGAVTPVLLAMVIVLHPTVRIQFLLDRTSKEDQDVPVTLRDLLPLEPVLWMTVILVGINFVLEFLASGAYEIHLRQICASLLDLALFIEVRAVLVICVFLIAFVARYAYRQWKGDFRIPQHIARYF